MNLVKFWLSRFFKPIATVPPMNLLLYPFSQNHKTRKSSFRQPVAALHVSLNHQSITVNEEFDSKLFALIIGINRYLKIDHLTGAVADADAVSCFLTTDLKVPSSHIINLRDDLASREAIVQALRSFKGDPRIQRGDPILIYYAGHGGSKKTPDEWKAQCAADRMQVIFPFDYNTTIPNSREVVNCIPDRTIVGLLNELAIAKGDNITVMFDSCHPTFSSRCGDENSGTGRLARSADVDIDIPVDIDADILSPKYGSKPDPRRQGSHHPGPLLCLDQSSHVFYAACGSNEEAYEEDGRGVFTVALMKTLRESGIDKITYRNLLTSLPMLPKQSPHCYGVHKSRILFNSRVPSCKVAFVPVKVERDELILNAGLSSGVTLGSIWELQVSAAEGSPTLGRLKARRPNSSRTALFSETHEAHAQLISDVKAIGELQLYARQVQSGTGNELRVYFSPGAKQLVFPNSELNLDPTGATGKSHREVGYVVHSSRDSADMVVEVYDSHAAPGLEQVHISNELGVEAEVVFVLCHPQAEKYDVARMRHRKPARREEVEPVLFAAARWHWHLKRTNDLEGSIAMVSMEMIKLYEVYGDYIDPVEEPLVNPNKTGVVDFVVREEDRYGLRLSSQVLVPLYIRAFYFDAMDFSINKMPGYSHSDPSQAPELPPCGQFMVGDCSKGGSMIKFSVTPGAALEVGFMKLFWSTDPLELDNLEQDSVFESDAHNVATQPSRKALVEASRKEPNWGTVVLTLVQRT
ncbi:hypothetical protein BDV93DRAFT_467797 [Ceratobasidium sp. AG-I]|nr:hypothetical protein BDV93DRAFT_467797 [Ceratobasidium sp. AG-I]